MRIFGLFVVALGSVLASTVIGFGDEATMFGLSIAVGSYVIATEPTK